MDNDLINQIRQQVDIVDVISGYIPLVKKGQGYFAVCPFHDDSHPSMSVSPQKQIYKCFVCNNGGNVFSFVQDYLKISFIEAVLEVAKHTNIDVSNYVYEKKVPVVKESSVVLYQMYENASKIYAHYLHTKQGIQAKEYTKSRNLTDEIIEKFGIGYSLKTNTLYDAFVKKEYPVMDMYRSGLIVESTKPHDRYYNRLMFPLHDHNGRVVGFSGRLLEDKDGESKYINSSESEIFTKGSILYNYHRVLPISKTTDFTYICEGFMDVVGMYKAGIENVVAIMGTALTKEHCFSLLKLNKKVVLCLDGDRAGKVATIKSAQVLLQHGLNVEVVTLPSGNDPDDIVTKHGVDELKAILDKKVTFESFHLDFLYEDTRMENYSSKKEYIEKSTKIISSMKDDYDKSYYANIVATRSGLELNLITNMIANTVINVASPQVVVDFKKSHDLVNKYVQAERNLLYYMLLDKEVSNYYYGELGYMFDDIYKVIASYVIAYYRNNMVLEVADFISGIHDEQLVQNIVTISELNLPPLSKVESDRTVIHDYVDLIKSRSNETEINDLTTELKEINDPNKKAEILERIIELKGKRLL